MNVRSFESLSPTEIDSRRTDLPRLALSPDEASSALGVSRDYFDEHVMPLLRVVRLGRRRLVPVRELERFLDIHAARALER
jgi:hypothetical protein